MRRDIISVVCLAGILAAFGPGGGAGAAAVTSTQVSKWTSPYAGWKNGPPADAGFFPISVWLQDPGKAQKYKAAGFNTYVGLWMGPTEQQLAEL